MRKLLYIVLAVSLTAAAQQASAHHDAVNKRGDMAMGFDHSKTAHHFILRPYGGDIDVSANDAADHSSRDRIRHHLSMIQKMFSAGDFSDPMFIHGRVPPGVPAMKAGHVTYAYSTTPNGARIKISSRDEKTIAAIHDFLKFQIADHETGDPLTVQSK
jgi:hypothetical protein